MHFSTKFTARTDLADETIEKTGQKRGRIHDGIIFETRQINGITVDKIVVENEKGENLSGKPKGKYFTVNAGDVWNGTKEDFCNVCEAVAKSLGECLQLDGLVLVACLGNERIIADAVGPMTARSLIVTRHIKIKDKSMFDSLELGETSCIVPGVMGDTGAEAAEIIKGTVQALRPKAVIAVDALACKNVSRLAKTVQITDAGICPGSGVGNNRCEISTKTLGVPTVAIGVPTVVESASLCLDILKAAMANDDETYNMVEKKLQGVQNFFVCPKETDKIIATMSKLIGYSINKCLHKSMTVYEMDEFLA